MPPILEAPILETKGLTVRSGERALLRGAELRILPGQVFGIIGPSGAGKSTLLRCLNRLVELTPSLRVSGEVLFHGDSIYRSGLDVDELRVRIGMLFQQPVVFPTSIAGNVLFGLRRLRRLRRSEAAEHTEAALRRAALWSEVKDRLREPATNLSLGQQQRLCLARLLAVEPEVILMDEPTSALDRKSTEAIEELIRRLTPRHTVVLVSHDLDQVARVAEHLACVCVREGSGEVVETACCEALLSHPQCTEAVEFLRGAGGGG